MKLGLVALILIVAVAAPALATDVSYAVVKGNVYDWETLEPLGGARVVINSTPPQSMLAWPNYTFELPAGDYRLQATFERNDDSLYAEENISVRTSGRFNIDLLLLPAEDELPDAPDLSEDVTFQSIDYFLIAAVIILAGVAALAFHRIRTPEVPRVSEINPAGPKPERLFLESDLQKVANIIKAEGRISQKDLRMRLPEYSEAKISLMLADLENRKIVVKFKKGRGNIIRLA